MNDRLEEASQERKDMSQEIEEAAGRKLGVCVKKICEEDR